MKLLDIRNKSRVTGSPALCQDKIGRIPESQLQELERLHQEQIVRVQRTGRSWSNPQHHIDLQLADGSLPIPDMEATSEPESEHSSVISISDRDIHTDSEHSDGVDVLEADNLKYRIPDTQKAAHDIETPPDTDPASAASTERPPTPPPKDSPLISDPTQGPALPGDGANDLESYFNPSKPSRAGSIYTLSRVSFTSQIAQLTSIRLPESSSLSSSIEAIPTSIAAAHALGGAADQIRLWIKTANKVLNGLDAEDDVEWAAAGGREGLEEVDNAINRFEGVITVYIGAVEQLQTRSDITSVSEADQKLLIDRMEEIVQDWEDIRAVLRAVKQQVEVAMEWEELWNIVLGEIGLETEALSRLVFEMEERRHRSAINETSTEPGNSIDIRVLESIVEEAPKSPDHVGMGSDHPRFNLPSAFPHSSPVNSPITKAVHEESNLLALFARLQPLRASLDFLPMRLSAFTDKAKAVFPSACEELHSRREVLEQRWVKLNTDSESLRRELGEDQWVLAFRNAGRQALKMYESAARSLAKLRASLDEGAYQTDLPTTAKKIESYEAKKMHYAPAIERIIGIIDKGVKDRLTLNGEILRLQADVKRRWAELKKAMKDMDAMLLELSTDKSQQLRDSISTILSTERSVSSSIVDTPGSSPASSVILMSRKGSDQGLSGSRTKGALRRTSSSTPSKVPPSQNRRYSSLPTSINPQKTPVSRSSASDHQASFQDLHNLSPVARYIYSTAPTEYRRRESSTPPASVDSGPSKPRWNASTNLKGNDVGHNFKPLALTTPSPYRRPSSVARSASRNSAIPMSSPLSRDTEPTSPAISTPTSLCSPHTPRNSASRAGHRLSSLQHLSSSSSIPRSSSSLGRVDPNPDLNTDVDMQDSPLVKKTRPPSAMASGRRSSMLPQPSSSSSSSAQGRRTSMLPAPSSSAGRADSRMGKRSVTTTGVPSPNDKPRWRS